MAQKPKILWESDSNRKTVRADIVVEKEGDIFVLDTKWKMPRYDGKIVPSDADLHQMYVYLDVYGKEEGKRAKKVALLYPGGEDLKDVKGNFVNTKAQCDMLFLPVDKCPAQEWQGAIAKHIEDWIFETR